MINNGDEQLKIMQKTKATKRCRCKKKKLKLKAMHHHEKTN
jgi:hypothetical protein